MALFARKNKNASPDTTKNGVVASADASRTAAPIVPEAGTTFSSTDEDATYGTVAGRKGKKNTKTTRSLPGLKGGSVVGLNIGNETIKAVELRGKGTDVVVTAVGSVPTPSGCLANGIILNPVSLSSALRDLFAQSNIKSRNVISSISASGSLVVRVLEVPRMSDAELVDNINTDLERYIPFPPNEVVKDFRALRELPSDPDSPNMEVLLAAAQNEVLDQHLQVLRDARIEPQSIDVEPLAASRAVLYGLTNNEGNGAGEERFIDYNVATAVVNIGATGTEISVLRGDILVFTRSVPVGGHSMTQALADTLGLAWPDAEQLKVDMGDALPPHNAAEAAQNAAYWSEFGDASNADGTSSAGAEDPFSSDFFERGPVGSDPQQQHQQKQGGDGSENKAQPNGNDEQLPSFDLSRFNFSDDEAIVDDDIPTSTLDEESPSPVSVTVPASNVTAVNASSGASTISAPEAALPVGNGEDVNLPAISDASQDNDEARLPSVVDFPPVDEDDSLSSMAPSGQMYGMNSVDDPDLLSFPALPVGLMAAGQESANYDDDDALPTLIEEGEHRPEINTPQIEPVVSSSTQTVEVPATTTVDSVFDFSTPAEATSNVDDFDTAFADMIGDTAPSATPIVTAPPVTPSAFSIDTTLASEESDFDLDQFATPDSADIGFGVDDFGFGDSGTITPAKVYEVLQPRLAELLGEVRRSLEYFSSRYPDTTVQRVILVGGGARLPNIDVMFTQELGMPTSIDSPLTRLPNRVANLPADFMEQQGATFAVATGLALRDVVA